MAGSRTPAEGMGTEARGSKQTRDGSRRRTEETVGEGGQ